MKWDVMALLVLLISLFVLFLYVLSLQFNWGKTAVAYYSATYCEDSECLKKQKVISEYIYPDELIGCPSEASVFQYFIMSGKVLVPVYDTYYIVSNTCQVFPINT